MPIKHKELLIHEAVGPIKWLVEKKLCHRPILINFIHFSPSIYAT